MEERKRNFKNAAILLVLMALLFIIVVFSIFIGRYSISVTDILKIIKEQIFSAASFDNETMKTIIFNIRIPRIFICALVGCCISSAGAAYQGVFQNSMAAPDILGASSGAAFGAALAILLSKSQLEITLSAFIFSMLTIVLVYFISLKASGKKSQTLILAGIIISSLFSAGTSFIKLVADPSNQLPTINYWLMGSLSGADSKSLNFIIFPMFLGLIPLLLFRWRINIITLGDDEAKAIGININKDRFIIILASTIVTASAVSVSGVIGWVGLVVPHLARRLIGNNYNYLMPATMLLGAIFLLIVDNVSRSLFTVEIPLGILTAFIGSPFFIYLIIRGRNVI